VGVTTVERASVTVSDESIALALHIPDGAGSFPCVLACHGLGASKESEKYLLLGDVLPRAGIALARFDFRGCGASSGVESETTVATRIDDAIAVLERLGKHPRLDGRIGVLGSSMGGFVALHVAALAADAVPVVTWNAPSDFTRMTRPDSASGLGRAFFEEIASGRYVSTPRGLRKHFVIQAAADDVVLPTHGEMLYARAAEPKRLLTIAGADHRLSDTTHRREAVDASQEWFARFF
jgi:uncharacterized protein